MARQNLLQTWLRREGHVTHLNDPAILVEEILHLSCPDVAWQIAHKHHP